MTDHIRTTCPYCGVGCGVLVHKKDDGKVVVKGDPDHPANYGKLCSKGSALGETLGMEDRLLEPKVNGRVVEWDEAIQTVASKFQETIAKHGPDSVAFYVSGQLLSEDYYVANKLIKGFIGTANIDTNSRLCMSSSVAGHKRAFGSDTVPQNFEDLENSDLVVLVGSNLAWCHPVLFQRLKKAKKKNGCKVVVIDPRHTATCEIADMHLAVKPGTDVLIFHGLLSYLAENGAKDEAYVAAHVQGCDEALEMAQKQAADYRKVAEVCDLPYQDLMTFYDWFLKTEKTLSVYSQGVNQSSQGTNKVNSILNCHLFTGRIGKEGCGPLSVTGQPNAMGGREVGGLANMLAAHMDFLPDDLDRVRRFWDAPNLATGPGQKAVDMFKAVYEGKIKAIWIMATNPAVSLPNVNEVREGLKKCDFVVVSDCIETTDTVGYGDVILPAATWGERNGTVTNTERCISRQYQFNELPGKALPDWKIITHVAQAMGWAKEFPYETSFDVFKEHVGLSAFENNGSRDFDLSGWLDMDRAGFDSIDPVQWPVSDTPKPRFFADGRFYTPTQRGNMLAIEYQPPVNAPSEEYPYILNTGRIRDQWHTMTRTGLTARLSAHISEPYLEINSEAASQEGLSEGDLVKIQSRWGAAILRVNISDTLRKGEIFMPMHWSDYNSARAVVGRVVNPVVDGFSGQPESKHTPVKVEKFQPDWYGLLISRKELDATGFAYWTRTKAKDCYVYDIAGIGDPADWQDYATVLLGEGELLSMEDKKRKHHRFALVNEGKPSGVLMVATEKSSVPQRGWIESLFSQDEMDTADRVSLLSAKPQGDMPDKGAIICSCFSVGLKEIQRAILNEGCLSVEQVGEYLKAGTNCGSCQAEIGEIITATKGDAQKVA